MTRGTCIDSSAYRTSIIEARIYKYHLISRYFFSPPQKEMAGPVTRLPPPVLRYRVQLPPACIPFASDAGRALFRAALEAGTAASYFRLAEQFATQADPAFCGLTTLVVCLNALSVDPGRGWKGVWRWFSEDMLDCCVSLESARAAGITLDAFACTARCNGASVTVRRPDARDHGAGLDEFRRTVESVARTPEGTVIVAAYARSGLGQTGSGHFSPLGAYDAASDHVLLLDVARFKYPPYWVPLSALYEAMGADDPATGRPRGYAVLKRDVVSPLLAFRLASLADSCDPSSGGGVGEGAGRLVCAIDAAIAKCMAGDGSCCAAGCKQDADVLDPTSILKAAVACFVECYIDIICVAGLPVVESAFEHHWGTMAACEGTPVAVGAPIPCSRAPPPLIQQLSPEHALGVAAILRALEQLDLFAFVSQALAQARQRSDATGSTLRAVVDAAHPQEAHRALMMMLVWGMLPAHICEPGAPALVAGGAAAILRDEVHRALSKHTPTSLRIVDGEATVGSSRFPPALVASDMPASLLAEEVDLLVQQMSALLALRVPLAGVPA